MSVSEPITGASVLPVEQRIADIGMRYTSVVPAGWTGGPTVVAVHGISRNQQEHARAFTAACINAGVALVVPRFSNSGYRGYQRLRPGKRGLSSDQALLAVLEDLQQRVEVPAFGDLRIFGFSGGAQFAHRFALKHPGRVGRLALASAGFYTFPNADVRYPYGLATRAKFGRLDPRGFLVPTKVFVGDRDTERDDDLRVGALVDRLQGRNRFERARRYVLAIRSLAGNAGLPPQCSLELLAGCDHEFGICVDRGKLVDRVLRFLVPETA